MSDTNQIEALKEALSRLAGAMATVPERMETINAQMRTAQQSLMQASIGICLSSGAADRADKFNEGLQAVRMACYSQVRLHTDLIAHLDAAQREVNKAIKTLKKGKANG
jgi:prefoldin subunit 5